jgi:hypothetical protein
MRNTIAVVSREHEGICAETTYELTLCTVAGLLEHPQYKALYTGFCQQVAIPHKDSIHQIQWNNVAQ